MRFHVLPVRYWLAAVLIFAFAVSLLPQIGRADGLSNNQSHLLQRLREESGDSFQVAWDEETRTPSLLAGRLTQPSRHTPEWISYTVFEKIKVLYGMNHPARTMKPVNLVTDEQGRTKVQYQHFLFDVPVWGDTLVVEIDRNGVVRSVRGQFTPDLEGKLFGRPIKPSVSAKGAITAAQSYVQKNGLLVGAKEPQLQMYYLPKRPGIQLVYLATFPPPRPGEQDVRVIVHALSGKVISDSKM